MRIALFMFFSLLTSFVYADAVVGNNPNEVIHSVSSNTFARINAEKNKLETQPGYIKVIIEEELIPYFDYKYAAYKVMGAHLKKTTKEQRNDFVSAFRDYLVNAYGHILYEYDQQEIEILDNSHFKDKRIISIPVRIRDKNGQVTQIAFKLRKNKKTGEWKVFDVIAEGISMLNTKQSEFGDLIHKKGIDHVIALLEKKNNEF
ncbi:MlaC/ttg2D family ABC transporter substrate-binding protein [Psychromonas sp. Urea-02u-13]|uniref:MlaC/ttg2D family ABC transporter substrate-binding protein n=1 Tax=Psychromonas sp. Urea-02u-13 TaxID=2058326 RepID=UPI000C345733|nr:ABC transporter substrate-binding protein [Psychromonas sp. Urea-02u-13]PKG38567.1 ABC transporter substrate-binding protein [Psychromonas sp. Urea-02u-13]